MYRHRQSTASRVKPHVRGSDYLRVPRPTGLRLYAQVPGPDDVSGCTADGVVGKRLKGFPDRGIAREAPAFELGSRLVQVNLVQGADEHTIQAWLFWNFCCNCR